MAIHAGKVKLTTALTSTGFELDNWSQRSQLSANNVSGNFNNYAFDNLNLTADWSGITRWKTGQPLQLSVATFNSGIVVQDIRLQVSLPKATPISSSARAHRRLCRRRFSAVSSRWPMHRCGIFPLRAIAPR